MLEKTTINNKSTTELANIQNEYNTYKCTRAGA